MNSCTTPSTEENAQVTSKLPQMSFTYTPLEIETLDVINAYRVSIGLKSLEKIDYISVLSEGHDNYMIAKNEINHDLFDSRSENLINVLGAKSVSENLAYNFSTSKSVLAAWLNSPTHKSNIEGDYTHFGIAIRENPVNGMKYFTNMFIKK